MRHKLSQTCRIIPPQMHAQVLSRFVRRIFSFHGTKKWATSNQNLTDKLIDSILGTGNLNDFDKTLILKNAQRLRDTKVNILITGATGCGKSSTINALFDSEKAKVGQGADPETMHIARYDLENIVLFDSPGLGDGKEADRRHAKGITDKLQETDSAGNLLIDLVLVILDGGSRDLGTSYELIEKVIIPNLGENTDRLLIAINQADMAMKGRHWNHEKNQPEPPLIQFLDEKAASTQRRIREATGVDVDVICYAAGYKDGDNQQYPWNLSKLLAYMLRHTKEEKRIVFSKDMNKNDEMWEDDDELEDYNKEIKKSFMESIKKAVTKGASKGAEIGREIGNLFGMGGCWRICWWYGWRSNRFCWRFIFFMVVKRINHAIPQKLPFRRFAPENPRR